MSFFVEQTIFDTWPALRYVAYAIIALLLAVIHVLGLNLIAVAGVTPDLLLILTVWIAVTEGQFAGQFAGFGCGLLFDIVSADVMGTNALAKAIAGFIAGYFYKEEEGRELAGSYKFLLIVLLCAFIHNLIYFFFYIRPTEIPFLLFFLKYGVASTLYTTVAAIFPMLIKSRRRSWSNE